MSKHFYRFRKVDNLIGKYQELEKQSIFFSAPEALNDPMEGFSDIHWKGDEILWGNLFKNYIMCLERLFSLYCVGGNDYKITSEDIFPEVNIENYPTLDYKNLINNIIDDFTDENIILLIKKITLRTTHIKREELFFYLNLIHIHAFNAILSNYQKRSLIQSLITPLNNPSFKIQEIIEDGYFEDIESLIKNHEASLAESIGIIQRYFYEQMTLLSIYNEEDSNNKNLSFLIRHFTSEYLFKLENLCTPKWYTACFMTECKNSSIWGSYGDNHAGICLIFESEQTEDDYYLPVNGITSTSFSSNDSQIKYNSSFYKNRFYPIDYQSNFVNFNFFTNLGSLNKNTLINMWLSNKKGEHSIYSEEIWGNESKWRENFWNNFIKLVTTKTQDWAFENEYRLILSSEFIDFSSIENRTLTYNFKSLVGIIFGIKTRLDDKIKIMKIIDKKCEENGVDDFKFYQAYYCSKQKCIDRYPLNLIVHTKSK